MRSLIDAENILKINSALNQLGESLSEDSITGLIARITKECDLNNYFKENCNEDVDLFLDKLLEELGIRLEISEMDLLKIPAEGAFVTISNHPYGVLDALLMLHAIRKVRKDYRCVTIPSFRSLMPLRDLLLSNDELPKDKLECGIGTFFINENTILLSSDSVKRRNDAADSELLSRLMSYRISIIPVAISVTNMLRFYLESVLVARLQRLMLSTEWSGKKQTMIQLKIGNPIYPEQQTEFNSDRELKNYLKAKINCMALPLTKGGNTTVSNECEEPITPAISKNVIRRELEEIGKEGLLFEIKNYAVYCVPSLRIPNILNEIGRLREVTFREVGEGTNKAIDLDQFDMYYNHLFIWDIEAETIVGAYRIGKGKEIIDTYGLKGFYIHTLFKIKRPMLSTLYQSLELGRSFVVSEYQRKPLPLFLLWKGILYFLLKHPEYRYLIGPVSISGHYNSLSKDLIVRFLSKYFWQKEYASLIHSRYKYKPEKLSEESILLLNSVHGDIGQFDKLIEDIEPQGDKLPILLKKYLSLNGKIIGFNIDPAFNMCLDGLLILDLFEVPMNTIASLAKELHDETILKRFSTE